MNAKKRYFAQIISFRINDRAAPGKANFDYVQIHPSIDRSKTAGRRVQWSMLCLTNLRHKSWRWSRRTIADTGQHHSTDRSNQRSGNGVPYELAKPHKVQSAIRKENNYSIIKREKCHALLFLYKRSPAWPPPARLTIDKDPKFIVAGLVCTVAGGRSGWPHDLASSLAVDCWDQYRSACRFIRIFVRSPRSPLPHNDHAERRNVNCKNSVADYIMLVLD